MGKHTVNFPLVSVIIPTRNNQSTIELTLKSIKDQTYPNWEIIVVDQYSQDKTVDIVRRYTDKVFFTKGDKFYSAPPVSRNLGAKKADGKYMLHIDSDMELSSKVLAECVETLEKNHDILALKIHEKDVGSGFWSKAKILERSCYIGYDAIESARFMRTETFFQLNGYDENLRSAEDWDMSKRIEKLGKIYPIKATLNHHLGKLSYFNQIKKKYNYGLTLDRIFKKHDFTWKKQFAMVFRSAYKQKWHLFLKDPIATLGFLILRPSEILAYSTGVIWARLTKTNL